METKYIAEFVELSETENFLQTSYDLYISQSSLSKHIKALEAELEIELFNRTTRQVRLSPEGKTFLPYAIKIKQLLDEYHSVCERQHREQTNTISLASTSQMTHYSVTDALAVFKREHLDCSINVVIEPHKNLKKLLLQHKVDFIWIGEPEHEYVDTEFTRVPFLIEPLVAVFSEKHPLAGKASISLEELCRHDIIIQDNSSIEQSVFLDFCKKKLLEPKITSLPGASIVDFAQRGLGIAIMLQSVAETLSYPKMSIVSIESSPIVHVNLLYLKDTVLSAAAREFLEFLEKWHEDT